MPLVPVAEGVKSEIQGQLGLYETLSRKLLNVGGRRVWLSQQGTCLACTKPWVLFPAPHKPDLVVHAYDPNTEGVESGGLKFKVSLSYIESLRLAWAT